MGFGFLAGLLTPGGEQQSEHRNAEEVPGTSEGQGEGDRNHHADAPEVGPEVTGTNPVTEPGAQSTGAHVDEDVHGVLLLAEEDVVGAVAGQTADHARGHCSADRTTDSTAASTGQTTSRTVDHDRHRKADELFPALGHVVGDVGVLVDGLLVLAVVGPELSRGQADVEDLAQHGAVLGGAVELAVLAIDLAGIADLGFHRETIPPLLLLGIEEAGDQLDGVLLSHLASTFDAGQDLLGIHAFDTVAVGDLVDRVDDDRVLEVPVQLTLGRLGQVHVGVDLVEHLGVDLADRHLGAVVGVGGGDVVVAAAGQGHGRDQSQQAQGGQDVLLHGLASYGKFGGFRQTCFIVRGEHF